MRALAYCGVVVGALLVLAAVALFIAAIWTVGSDSARLASTGGVSLFAGGVLGGFGLMGLDVMGTKR